MALKSVLLISVLVGIMAASAVEAQLGLLGPILGLFRIQGTLFCTVNGKMGVNGTATPVFPNATVQLQCGSGNVVSSATTNGAGIFSILLDPLQFVLSTVLNNCKLVVPTPLSTCNSALPSSGGLISTALRVISTILLDLGNVVNIVPVSFQLLNVLP